MNRENTIGWMAVVAALTLATIGAAGCGESRAGGVPETTSEAKTPAAAANIIERGQYMVTIGGCNDCHTPLEMGPNGPEPNMERMLSGHPESAPVPEPPAQLGKEAIFAANITGTAFVGPWGVSFARNLTPDTLTGIGIWTEEMFIKTIRSGKHWGTSRPIMPPMPWFNYAKATDDDLKAIYAYLRTVPPVNNQVPEYRPPAQPLADAGAAPAPGH